MTIPCLPSFHIVLLQEHGIPLIKVDSNMKLGEWAGLCKIDQEGKARKVVKCSAAVVSVFSIVLSTSHHLLFVGQDLARHNEEKSLEHM